MRPLHDLSRFPCIQCYILTAPLLSLSQTEQGTLFFIITGRPDWLVTRYFPIFEDGASHESRCSILLVYTALKRLSGAVQTGRNEQHSTQ